MTKSESTSSWNGKTWLEWWNELDKGTQFVIGLLTLLLMVLGLILGLPQAILAWRSIRNDVPPPLLIDVIDGPFQLPPNDAHLNFSKTLSKKAFDLAGDQSLLDPDTLQWYCRIGIKNDTDKDIDNLRMTWRGPFAFSITTPKNKEKNGADHNTLELGRISGGERMTVDLWCQQPPQLADRPAIYYSDTSVPLYEDMAKNSMVHLLGSGIYILGILFVISIPVISAVEWIRARGKRVEDASVSSGPSIGEHDSGSEKERVRVTTWQDGSPHHDVAVQGSAPEVDLKWKQIRFSPDDDTDTKGSSTSDSS